MSFPRIDKDPDLWLSQVDPILRSLFDVCHVESASKFIADVNKNHILSIIDAFLIALPGSLDWESKIVLTKNDGQHNEVERTIRKLIKTLVTILVRLITLTDEAENNAMLRKVFKINRYVKVMSFCGPKNATALGRLLADFLDKDKDQLIAEFFESEIRNHWDCQVIRAIHKQASGQSMLFDKDVNEWLVQWLLALSKSVNAVGKFVKNCVSMSRQNWRNIVTEFAELLECVSVYINDDILSSCRVWSSRGKFRNLLEIKNYLLNMLVSYFYAALQIPDITLAERVEFINDLNRLPWALTLLSHSPKFDVLLQLMITNNQSQYDNFVAQSYLINKLFIAPMLVNSHSFNCLLSTADIPSKIAKNRPPSNVRIETVIYTLVLAYFNNDISITNVALKNPALLPSYLRILVEANPAVNAIRFLRAAKNVFPVIEDQEGFNYSTFFKLNYLTVPYFETLANVVGESKPLSKLQKLIHKDSTTVNIDEDIVVIDKISRRDLRYVRLPRYEHLFLKDVYETILIAATPDLELVKQFNVGTVREEFVYEMMSSENDEYSDNEENSKEKPIRVNPLNEPLPQTEEDSEDRSEEASEPPPSSVTTQPRNHHRGRGYANVFEKKKGQDANECSKSSVVDNTKRRNRQVKERSKNRNKQRGEDHMRRQTGFL